MNRRNTLIVIAALAALSSSFAFAQRTDDQDLLRIRERVWRAWFAGDTKSLEDLVPPGTIVISGGEADWKRQSDVLQSAAEFHSQGGTLVRLEFPHTEIQHFGDVAIVWSNFVLETDMAGKRTMSSGRASEIFVWQNAHWTNPGWHTDSYKKPPQN